MAASCFDLLLILKSNMAAAVLKIICLTVWASVACDLWYVWIFWGDDVVFDNILLIIFSFGLQMQGGRHLEKESRQMFGPSCCISMVYFYFSNLEVRMLVLL